MQIRSSKVPKLPLPACRHVAAVNVDSVDNPGGEQRTKTIDAGGISPVWNHDMVFHLDGKVLAPAGCLTRVTWIVCRNRRSTCVCSTLR